MVETARKMGSRQSASPLTQVGVTTPEGGDLSLGTNSLRNVAKSHGYPTAHRIPYLAVSAANFNQSKGGG